MADVKLTIWSAGQTQIIPLTTARLTLGRGEQVDLRLSDQGLSRLHISFHQEGEQVWVRDEGSLNGSFVNGQPVLASGYPVSDGDRVTLGDETLITVTIVPNTMVITPARTPRSEAAPLLAVATAMLILLGGLMAVAVYAWRQQKPTPNVQAVATAATVVLTPLPTPSEASDSSALETSLTVDADLLMDRPATENVNNNSRRQHRYQQMTLPERLHYIEEKVQEVARMIGNRPAVFPPIAITSIQSWVDAYAKRVGNGRRGLWGGDLNRIFERAQNYTPTIIAAFQAHKAPVVVGVYLPFIETEYENIKENNRAGAAGLFQFLGRTAKAYGVPVTERTNIEKMAPAAARYINDRMKDFGADAVGVGLSIAGYNRDPASIKRDLHTIINPENRERDFWTLMQNKAQLDRYFQGENSEYVPRFFAAAIIGENPRDFGLAIERKLSTYTAASRPAEKEIMTR